MDSAVSEKRRFEPDKQLTSAKYRDEIIPYIADLPRGGAEFEKHVESAAKDEKTTKAAIRLDVEFYRKARPAESKEGAGEQDINELRRIGAPVLEAESYFEYLRPDLRRVGSAGDTRLVELVALAVHSRLLKRPTNLVISGQSAAGKTYIVEKGVAFHPPDAVHDITAMSERALAYSDFKTEHAYVWISEASALYDDGIGATILRALAWGDGIKYETVIKGVDGRPKSLPIRKPGPTGLITTTTRPALDPELSTRCLVVNVDDTPAQTRAVIDAHAKFAANPGYSEDVDFEIYHAAARFLELSGNRQICVPFAEELVAALPDTEVRMRRDVEQILALISVSALVHQLYRETDRDGFVVADRRDYETAHRLLEPVLSATLRRATDTTRATVEAVAGLSDKHRNGVKYAVLEDALGVGRSTVSWRVRKACRDGFLVNAELRKGHLALIQLGDALPDDSGVLPHPNELFGIPRALLPGNDSDSWTPSRNVLTDNEIEPSEQVSNGGNLPIVHPPHLDTHLDTSKPLSAKELRQGIQVSNRNPGCSVKESADPEGTSAEPPEQEPQNPAWRVK